MNKNTVFSKYKLRAEQLFDDNESMRQILDKTSEKLNAVISSNDKIEEFTNQILTFYRMVSAQLSGEYKNTPWKTLIMIFGSLLYFITPLDMIPDFIPGLGFTDDIAIIFWIYNSVKEDIRQFEQWEKSIEVEPIDEH